MATSCLIHELLFNPQRAMREQKIELREIETDYNTGTDYDNTGSGSKPQGGPSKS